MRFSPTTRNVEGVPVVRGFGGCRAYLIVRLDGDSAPLRVAHRANGLLHRLASLGPTP